MTSTFSIRKATDADARPILDCLRAAFAPYESRYTPEAFADTVLNPTTIQQRMAKMTLFVATAPAEEVVGTIACCMVNDEEGHLRGMAVLPAWQGRGVAEQLLQAAEDELRARNCSRITLNTTEPLKRAVGFYEKHGFRASGKVTGFFRMPLYEYVKRL